MTDADTVPVWTLTAEENPAIGASILAEFGPAMSRERLDALRGTLALVSRTPIATLELHSLKELRDRSRGLVQSAASPLARELTRVTGPVVREMLRSGDAGGGVLYRMVVPAEFVKGVRIGAVKPMTSSRVSGGIHSALRDSSGIVANASFVPVTRSGASAGAAATAGIAGAGALTIAGPLILMALAVGASAYADAQRQTAFERVTQLLEKLEKQNLDQERVDLEACRRSIESATAVMLDAGSVGPSMGLDSAVYTVNQAITRATTRVEGWRSHIEALREEPVALNTLVEAFPGIDQEEGEFYVHVELARLAIAFERRILLIQAVEHAELSGSDNRLSAFLQKLQQDEAELNELESQLNGALIALSELRIGPARGRLPISLVSLSKDVEGLVSTIYRLRELGREVHTRTDGSNMVVEVEQDQAGSLVVFPASVS